MTVENAFHFLPANLSVELCGYRYPIRDDPLYNNWLTVAAKPYIISVPPTENVKDSILVSLLDYSRIIAREGGAPTTLIAGRQYLSAHNLLHHLSSVGVQDLRLVAFGMKSPIEHYYGGTDLYVDHHLASTNRFDVGVFIDFPGIPLLNDVNTIRPNRRRNNRRRNNVPPPITVYPMLTVLGQGYGSVQFRHGLPSQEMTVKAYPRLVHALKAYDSRISMEYPRGNGIHGRLNTLAGLKQWLTERPDDYTGLRIEVSVYAPSIQEAQARVQASQLLTFPRLLQVLGGQNALRLVPIDQYLQQLEVVFLASRTLLR